MKNYYARKSAENYVKEKLRYEPKTKQEFKENLEEIRKAYGYPEDTVGFLYRYLHTHSCQVWVLRMLAGLHSHDSKGLHDLLNEVERLYGVKVLNWNGFIFIDDVFNEARLIRETVGLVIKARKNNLLPSFKRTYIRETPEELVDDLINRATGGKKLPKNRSYYKAASYLQLFLERLEEDEKTTWETSDVAFKLSLYKTSALYWIRQWVELDWIRVLHWGTPSAGDTTVFIVKKKKFKKVMEDGILQRFHQAFTEYQRPPSWREPENLSSSELESYRMEDRLGKINLMLNIEKAQGKISAPLFAQLFQVSRQTARNWLKKRVIEKLIVKVGGDSPIIYGLTEKGLKEIEEYRKLKSGENSEN